MLCDATMSTEVLADLTWVQSAIAVWCDYFVLDIVMYLGSVNNNCMC